MGAQHYSKQEVDEVARSLGFQLQEDDLEIYHDRINQQIEFLDRFYEEQGSWEPEMPSVPGRHLEPAPADQPDPYGAWLWRGQVTSDGDGPLNGVTVGLKDHIPLEGAPLTYGSTMLEGNRATFDAPIVTRLLAAGATIVGKNNMDNFSMPGTERGGRGGHPKPLNPAAPGRAVGGSSSGGGAAVAAGECDIAIGGDQGGSVRIPAAFCGVVGLKPTYGAISHYGIIGSDPSVDAVGPLTRTVELNALAFQAIAGRDGFDHRQGGVPESFDVMSTIADGVAGLRIGLLVEGCPEGTEPAIRERIELVAADLERLGAVVSTISLPDHPKSGAVGLSIGSEGSRLLADSGYTGAFSLAPIPTSVSLAVARARAAKPELVPPGYKLRHMTAEFARRRWRGSLYAAAMNARIRMRAMYDAAFEEVDVLLMPTIPFFPAELVTYPEYRDQLEAVLTKVGLPGFAGTARVTSVNTMPFNQTGHPALAYPVANPGELPMSAQFVGRYFREDHLYRCAYALERMRPESDDRRE